MLSTSWAYALLSILSLASNLPRIKCVCPDDIDDLRRVGNTRFYIIHALNRSKAYFVDFKSGKAECAKHGLEMAKIKNMLTMAYVGRPLEKLIEQHKLKDTWYWIDAKFDYKREAYQWGEDPNGDIVQYSNILYRPNRPTGVTGHVNWKGVYSVQNNKEQCLALALPWPAEHTDPRQEFFGHQTIFDERDCKSVQQRHVLCESTDTSCDHKTKCTYRLNEDRKPYFEDGMWIFGDRKYIFNWKHRTLNDTLAYCQSIGLQLYKPGVNETGLIPYLKMWSREVTTSQFWTDYNYNVNKKRFIDTSTGTQVHDNDDWHENFAGATRSQKTDPDFCVAMALTYEFKGQLPCLDQTDPRCTWSFYDFFPANCNNYLGTICQHPDKDTRDHLWDDDYTKNVDKGLREMAVTKEFGFEGNTKILRSRYKQTYGVLHCPDGYRMLRTERAAKFDAPPSPAPSKVYTYDYMETYWVVGNTLWNMEKDSKDCFVSVPTGGIPNGVTRRVEKRHCGEWHFYACEKLSSANKARGIKPAKQMTMFWREGPQPRLWPLTSVPLK